MKKEPTPHDLTVIDQTVSSSDNGESIKFYMKQLQRIPLLTREQEVKLARTIIQSKEEIITICCAVPECLSEIYMLRDLSVIELRKLFFSMIDEDSSKEEISKLTKKLEVHVTNALKEKKNGVKNLVEYLKGMGFTLNDLTKLAKPVTEYGSPAQIKALNISLANFKQSKNKMIESNLRLVFSRAKIYMNKGLSLEDLLQEGNIGLIKAIDKYDVEKGFKFGTYATWWIDQSLGRAVADKGRLIRIPVHMVENINRITKATKQLTQNLGQDPTVEQLSAHTDISEDKIKKVKKIASFPQSVEEPMGDIGIPLSEYLVDTETPDPYMVMERKELAQKVRHLLSKLSPREEKVLRMRFGIGEKRQSILENIGSELGVSRERARQIISQGLKKLSKVPTKGGYNHDWTEYKKRLESSSET